MDDVAPNVLRLIYVGKRWSGPKISFGWLLEDDDPAEENVRLYTKMRGSSIGGIYTVEHPPEKPNSVYPTTLTYTMEKVDDRDQVAIWQAVDADVQRQASRQAAERKHAKSSELDEAMQPLVDLAFRCRNRYEMTALRDAVSERMQEAFWKKQR